MNRKRKNFQFNHTESKRNEAGGKKGMNCFLVASFDGLLSRSMGKTFTKSPVLSVSKKVIENEKWNDSVVIIFWKCVIATKTSVLFAYTAL